MKEDIYFQNKIKDVLDIYSQIELEILEKIIDKLKLSDGEIGGSTEWLLKRLNELGGLNKETLKVISKYTGISQKQLKAMLESIGIDTIDALNLQEAYRKGKISINPKTFYKDRVIASLITNSYDSTLKIRKIRARSFLFLRIACIWAEKCQFSQQAFLNHKI